MHKHNNPRGFTLIELLVVISIISLLSSSVLAAVQESRDQAAASSVISSMNQLRTALEAYRQENGNYPREGGPGATAHIGNRNGTHYDGQVLNKLTPDFMSTLPKVPSAFRSAGDQFYVYYENVLASNDWWCGGERIEGGYVVYYYWVGAPDHGSVPDNFSTLSVGSTAYPHLPCISSD